MSICSVRRRSVAPSGPLRGPVRAGRWGGGHVPALKAGHDLHRPMSPIRRAPRLRRLLELDPVFLLSKVIAENDPALWDAISDVMGEHLMTKNELALIHMVRQGLDGHDVSLADSLAFIQGVAQELKATLDCQSALTQAAIERIDK